MFTTEQQIQRTLVCERGEDPERFIHALVDGRYTFALSMAPIALVGVLEAAIYRMGKADVTLASWWLSVAQTETLVGMKRAGYIRSLTLVLDPGMKTRVPEAAHLIESQLPGSILWRESHLKALTIQSVRTGETLTVMTSQADPGVQTEWWCVSPEAAVHSWLTAYLQGSTKADTLPQDVSTALRVQSTLYQKRKGAQDARSDLARAVVRPAADPGSIGLIGGPTIAPLGLLAGYAARMGGARATLIGWWLSTKSVDGVQLLERVGLFSSSRSVVSATMDGVYNRDAGEYLRSMIPADRRRYADNHAKMALLESADDRVAVLSTGNWQVTSPRAELFWVTRDVAVLDLVGRYADWIWAGCPGRLGGFRG